MFRIAFRDDHNICFYGELKKIILKLSSVRTLSVFLHGSGKSCSLRYNSDLKYT